MSGVVALSSNNLNDDIIKHIRMMPNRGDANAFYSDGVHIECKRVNDGKPYLNGNIGVGWCGVNNSNHITFPGYSVVYDGKIDTFFFKNLDNPISVIQNLINTSNEKFFGVCVTNGELYAFKDKTGAKPGMYGMNSEGNIVICSEDLGFTKSDDIYGGEILHIKNNTITRNAGNIFVIPNIYEFLYFARGTSNIYGLSVEDFRDELSTLLIKDLGTEFNAIINVSDKTRIYGITIANILEVPYMEPKTTHHYRKKFNIYEKYQFKDIHFKYDNILIIDLFIASGNTAKFFVDTFKSKNCNNITILSLSPKYRFPDIGPKKIFRDELIDPENASQTIGCKVIYNTDENLKFVSGFEQISY